MAERAKKAGGQAGNTSATTHGATSRALVKRHAATQKRRLLRQIGLRQADMTGVGLGYLDSWARAQAKVELMDAYFEEHGFLDRRGKPRPATKLYFVAVNSARLALGKFQEYLRDRGHGEQSMVIEMQGAERE